MWFLSLRLLLARKRQTVLSLSGVMLGTATFISFAGMLDGFQGYIIDQLVNNDSHVRISVREELITRQSLDKLFFPNDERVYWISPPSGRRDSARLENPVGWFQRLGKDYRVLAYSPQYQSEVIFSRAKATKVGRIIGSIPDKQIRVSNVQNYMTKGDFLNLSSGGNRLIVGDELLESLGARVGDSILVAAGKKEPVPFMVIGAFNFGVRGVDSTTAFASLTDVQKINNASSQISDIAIRLTDVTRAKEVANQWSFFSQDKVQSWDEANKNILSVFMIQNFTKHFVTIAILVVASFGIYNILNILVNQKRKDIGILRSIGYESGDIVLLFLWQGLVLGLGGGVLGIGLGYVICKFLSTLKIGGMMDELLISFDPNMYVAGFLMAVLASVFSSTLPAREAGRLEPIDIVRSGE